MNHHLFIASTLANDPHTEGLHNAGKVAGTGGIKSIILKPSASIVELCEIVREFKPKFIGLSYRLSPEIGFRELVLVLCQFRESGLFSLDYQPKITFAGLPRTIEMLESKKHELPYRVYPCFPYPNVEDRLKETIAYFEIKDTDNNIFDELKENLLPKGIKIFDELADEVLRNEDYKLEPPLKVPSTRAIDSYVCRIQESDLPILRSHFGVPSESIEPTVEGIKELAEARVLDEISLGSSDLSQRYFGYPEMFKKYKNDGGVPYKTPDDLRKIFFASRCGNFPSVKPYCHVTEICKFIDTCLDVGLLKGAHQAIPLFWFNELDGRGSATVRDSIKEHIDAVKKLALLGIPVEMNDPNQWSSRLSHDTIIVLSYALISAVMSTCGVQNMVLQMQFNKPRETGDLADLAKMAAGLSMVSKITKGTGRPVAMFKEVRTGIESLSFDMDTARKQLARSTLLQMCVYPDIIHVVSYCEANYAAKPADIIDSSKLIRRSVKVFKENETDIREALDTDYINSRKEYLETECEYLVNEIARLHPRYRSCGMNAIAPFIGNPDVLATAIEKKIISAPGIINERYKGSFITKAMKGEINLVSDFNNPKIITEKERLALMSLDK